MWKFGVISLALVSVIVTSASGDAIVDDRILNGVPAERGQFPFVAQVSRVADSDKSAPCVAAIINNRHVLITAVCARQFVAHIQFTIVRVGSTIRSGGTPHNAKSISIHSEYEELHQQNNLAIIQLYQYIEFTPNVQPARLPTVNLKDAGGESVTTMGWGVTTVSIFRSV